MKACVKVKGIDVPCYVTGMKKILAKKTSGAESEIRDFEEVCFASGCYYVFVGEQILHIWGHSIEFVSFQ